VFSEIRAAVAATSTLLIQLPGLRRQGGGWSATTARSALRASPGPLRLSAYSLRRSAAHAKPLFKTRGPALITLSYLGAERAIPQLQTWMGVAKAARRLRCVISRRAGNFGPQKPGAL